MNVSPLVALKQFLKPLIYLRTNRFLLRFVVIALLEEQIKIV